jgi:hypothetical protein
LHFSPAVVSPRSALSASSAVEAFVLVLVFSPVFQIRVVPKIHVSR